MQRPSSAMLGLKSSLKRYSCIRRTKTQNASSSGICKKNRDVQSLWNISFVHVFDKISHILQMWVIVSDITCSFQQTIFNPSLKSGFLRPLPALAADQQWTHFLDSIPPLDPPGSMPEEYTHTSKTLSYLVFCALITFIDIMHVHNYALCKMIVTWNWFRSTCWITFFFYKKLRIRLDWPTQSSTWGFDISKSI